jgi:hypothetical protein
MTGGMDREPSTPVRRMKDCRIMYRPLRLPTLIAYPPPPPEPARPRPIMALPRVEVQDAPSWASSPRSSTRRRRRDCVFIPDMDLALQFIEARRLAEEEAGVRARQRGRDDLIAAGLPQWSLDTPVVLGLLMTFLPPLAVTLVWSSRRFSRTAQIALTLYGGFTMVLMAGIVIAALV